MKNKDRTVSTGQRYSPAHNRVAGVVSMLRHTLASEGGSMSPHEVRLVSYLIGRLSEILSEDKPGRDAVEVPMERKEPLRCSRQYLNTQCEFFDLDSSRIQCAIGCDLYQCGKSCRYATNVPGSLPPYGTKYMKGHL